MGDWLLNYETRSTTDAAGMGIDIPDITLVVQYRVLRELSNCILIAELSYFDDEKEKVAQKATERNMRKRQAEGQLQPSTSQHYGPHVSMDGHQPTGSMTQIADPETCQDLRCEKAMDNFINAERRLEKCHHNLQGCQQPFWE
ncbi:hypothetical protein L208DRAFT_1459833 [Tricholoma matsutake]|nr:hypothetical protein L208DRAFT_1459833 [Tricholoma matsutake 945]